MPSIRGGLTLVGASAAWGLTIQLTLAVHNYLCTLLSSDQKNGDATERSDVPFPFSQPPRHRRSNRTNTGPRWCALPPVAHLSGNSCHHPRDPAVPDQPAKVISEGLFRDSASSTPDSRLPDMTVYTTRKCLCRGGPTGCRARKCSPF